MGIIVVVILVMYLDFLILRCFIIVVEIVNIGKIDIYYYKMVNDVKVFLVYEKLLCFFNVNKFWKLDFFCSLVWLI